MTSHNPGGDGPDDHVQGGGQLTVISSDQMESLLPVESGHKEPSSYPRTDLGQAELFRDRHADKIKYSLPLKKWLCWDGRRWKADDTGRALDLANETTRFRKGRAKDISDQKIRIAEFAFASKSEMARGRDGMLAQVRSFPQMNLDPGKLDAQQFVLNCTNGVLDMGSQQLQPHCSKQLNSKICATHYDPTAECPQWESLLEWAMLGNRSLVEFIQRAVGYSFSGSTRESKAFVLFGDGDNGKSVFIQTITGLLGEYATIAASHVLMLKPNSGGGPNPELAMLRGARLISISETPANGRLDEATVKQFVGGDPVTARFCHADPITFIPTGKVWLSTNYKPEIRGGDHGIWRRIRPIPFMNKIEEASKDKELAGKLKAEWPGILAWAIRGFQDWYRNGLQEPEEIRDALQSYRAEMDSVQIFLDDCCVREPFSTTSANDLYSCYRKWCETNGEYCLSSRTFGLRLRQKGIETYRGYERGYKGLRLGRPNLEPLGDII